jgi:copper(I)-binding protein
LNRIILTLSIVLLGWGAAHATVDDAGAASSLGFENQYAYATTSVQKNGAVFMTIHSRTEDERIVSARSPIAQRVELHTHIMDGDTMMMRAVAGYDIPAGGSVTLEPMGHHIMLMGLHAPLKAGEHFPLTLPTGKGAEITIDVAVKNPGDTTDDTMGDAQ